MNFKLFCCFRNFYSSHSPFSFFVSPSLSVVHPSALRHFFSRTFCSPRSFGSATSVVSINCLFSSSSSTAMNSSKTIKPISNHTNNTVPSYNPHSLKAAIKTLALKIGNGLNNGTISPSTRKAFFKIMYNVFSLSSKKIPFEQYYRLHVSGPSFAFCETKSNKVFVLTHTSFDQNNFYLLHTVQESIDAFNAVMQDFGFFFQKLAPYDSSKDPTQPDLSTHSQNFQPGLL